jgi:hypothetical protein
MHPIALRRPAATTASLALACSLLLAACGGGGDDEASAPATTDAPASTTAAPEPEEVDAGGGAASVDACALLSPAVLEDTVAFEFGGGTWTQDDDAAPGTCSWTNDEQLTTIAVEVRQGIDETLQGVDAGTGTEVEEIEVGAATATGVRDTAADRLGSLYVPAGADSVVKLTQSPLKVDDEAMIALAEAAAIAFENLPVGGSDGGAGGGDAAAGDLESVRITVQSSDAGIDLELEVTAADAAEVGNPVQMGIVCAGSQPGEGGLFGGVYAVSTIDLDRDPGLVSASIESSEEVAGPGSYPGVFRAADSQGRSVDVDGQLTIDEGLRSGELIGEDEAGNQVAVTWECRPLI